MDTVSAKYQISSLTANLAIAAGKEPEIVAVASCNDVDAVAGLAMAISNYYVSCDKRVLVAGCGHVGPNEASFLTIGDASDILSFDIAGEMSDSIAADEKFVQKIKELAPGYDCTVIAVPFAHKTVDAVVASRISDVTILAVVEEQTRRKDLKKASENLKRGNATIAGVCMVTKDK